MNPLESMQDRSEMGQAMTALGLTGHGVEVGVFRGEFSHRLLLTWRGSLTGIDSYNCGTEFHILSTAVLLNEIFIRDGRYEIFVCSSIDGSRHVEDGLNFVYIDAEHTEEAVAQDIAAWWPKIKVGGVLCGHDYRMDGNGVDMAVAKFMSKHPQLKLYTKPCSSWFVQKL